MNKEEIKSFNPNFFTNYIIYSCVHKKRTPATIKRKVKVSHMNLEDKVDNYLRLYIQKDIPITREQADEINEYKCELKNRIDKAIEYMNSEEYFELNNDISVSESQNRENYFKAKSKLLEILKGKSE